MTSCYSIVKNGIYLNKAKTNISYLVIIIDLREKCLVLKWGLLLSEYMNRLSKSVSQYFSNHHLVFVLSNKNMVFFLGEKNCLLFSTKTLKRWLENVAITFTIASLKNLVMSSKNRLLKGGGQNKQNQYDVMLYEKMAEKLHWMPQSFDLTQVVNVHPLLISYK